MPSIAVSDLSINKSVERTAKQIGKILKKNFPGILAGKYPGQTNNNRDENKLNERISIVLYLELLHFGYFDKFT
jgi:hypothetical protein